MRGEKRKGGSKDGGKRRGKWEDAEDEEEEEAGPRYIWLLTIS